MKSVLIAYRTAKYIESSRLLSSVFVPVAQWWRGAAGYRKYGLKFDDLISEESQPAQEAMKRIPKEELYKREYRNKVALNEGVKQTFLPQEKWTKEEEDKRYLTPALIQVLLEAEEKDSYNLPSKKF